MTRRPQGETAAATTARGGRTGILTLFAVGLAGACGQDPAGPSGDEPAGDRVAVSVTVEGGGAVTSDPAGIACPGDCAEHYTTGTVVTLTATPEAGWHFVDWGGACSGGTTICRVTVTAPGSVTANFTDRAALAVSVSGDGTVSSSPAGIACPDDCVETYASGTRVVLQATPAEGWRFTGWAGSASGCGASLLCDVPMEGSRIVQATFRREVALHLFVRGSGTVTGGGFTCHGSSGASTVECVHTYAEGTEVTLTAAPAAGWQGTPWGDFEASACLGTVGPTCVVTLTENRSVSTRFAPVRIVRLVYLVPADRDERSDYATAVDAVGRHLRIWLHGELATRRTIALGTGNRTPSLAVEVYRTPRQAHSYASAGAGSDALLFWTNVLADAFALTGARFNDPNNIWLFYVDADPGCGQLTGGTSGVALLPANDLRGLVGEANQPPCSGQTPDNAPPCRWVGGSGHELGHALGLPHPPGCEAGSADCPLDALMWLGFGAYPATYLTEVERAALNDNPFFSSQDVPPLFDCTTLAAAPSSVAATSAMEPGRSTGRRTALLAGRLCSQTP